MDEVWCIVTDAITGTVFRVICPAPLYKVTNKYAGLPYRACAVSAYNAHFRPARRTFECIPAESELGRSFSADDRTRAPVAAGFATAATGFSSR